jgi:pimeloyl-ACP methyl ester carboxylesterase
MPQNTNGFDDVGHGPALVYLRLGNSAPAIISNLARKFRVLASRGDGTDVFEQFAPSMRTLGIERLGIIAQAASCPLALKLAAAHPDMIEAVALIAPPAIGDGSDVGPLADVKQPTLVLLGTRDKASPPQAGKAYRQAMSACHLAFVYDATADMDIERPEAVEAILRDFMTARDRFVVSKKNAQIYP